MLGVGGDNVAKATFSVALSKVIQYNFRIRPSLKGLQQCAAIAILQREQALAYPRPRFHDQTATSILSGNNKSCVTSAEEMYIYIIWHTLLLWVAPAISFPADSMSVKTPVTYPLITDRSPQAGASAGTSVIASTSVAFSSAESVGTSATVQASVAAVSSPPGDFGTEIVRATQNGTAFTFTHHIGVNLANNADNNEVIDISAPLLEAGHNFMADDSICLDTGAVGRREAHNEITYSDLEMDFDLTGALANVFPAVADSAAVIRDFAGTINIAFEMAYARLDGDGYYHWAPIKHRRVAVSILGVLMILEAQNIHIQSRLILNNRLFRNDQDNTIVCGTNENAPKQCQRIQTALTGVGTQNTVSRQSGVNAINQFCGSGNIDKDPSPIVTDYTQHYFNGTDSWLELRIDFGQFGSVMPSDDCKDFLLTILDGCDGNSPDNPGDWKHGGTIDYQGGLSLELTPLAGNPIHCNNYPLQKWVDINIGVDAISQFCLDQQSSFNGPPGLRIESEYNQGTSTDVKITLSYYESYDMGVSDCISQFRNTLDNCDHNDPTNNPFDDKYGGTYTNTQGAVFMVTPLAENITGFPPTNGAVVPTCGTDGKVVNPDDLSAAYNKFCQDAIPLYSANYN
ncbi:hypothetical protein BDZ45DRAFT_696573 [Acephala macrosclerotiorum]|nr:hypothetical protein BDZ45DRAFT_696573 [Acephala macrosclerotiorum]